MLGGLLVALAVALIWALALYRWFESREIWNGGVCSENGLPWQVKIINGSLYLFAGDRSQKISGVLVYGPILRAADCY